MGGDLFRLPAWSAEAAEREAHAACVDEPRLGCLMRRGDRHGSLVAVPVGGVAIDRMVST